MRYKLMGRSGLRVSELCLGTMTFGQEWAWGAPMDECRAMFNAYVEAGGNFLDTANYYMKGTSERIVGEFLKGKRAEFVLATKYTLCMRPRDPNAGGNQRKNMVQSVEESLTRLGTDYIDLYWVHAWDPMTPVEEIMRGLDDLVRAGKILYIGISDAPAWWVAQANTLAECMGWSRFVGLQIPYSLVERTPERELLPMAKALDLAVAAWSPLGGGVLSGKYEKGKPFPTGDRLSDGNWSAMMLNDWNLEIARVVREVANELGRTPSQVAIAWLLGQQERALVIPIVGARKQVQLVDNLEALSFTIPTEALARLEEISKPELGFPLDFLDHVRALVYGETYPSIDNHRS